MIVPVKLKPFSEWTCQCAGYEPQISREQMEAVSGMTVEIETDSLRPDDWRPGRAWRVTAESEKRVLLAAFGVELPVTGQLVICEHMIELGD
jgi:hypothetical protein